MEAYEKDPARYLLVGEIEPVRVSEDIGNLYLLAERRLQPHYPGRPVPPTDIYRQLRFQIESDMYKFPFYDPAERTARLVSVGERNQRYVLLDDLELLTPYGVDFRFSASFAIWATHNELGHKGFEYDPDRHQLNPTLGDVVERQIADAFPQEIKPKSNSTKTHLKPMRRRDAADLAVMVLEESHARFKKHAPDWEPLLREHSKLFMQDTSQGEHFVRAGLGFGMELADALKTELENHCALRFNLELESKGVQGYFGIE